MKKNVNAHEMAQKPSACAVSEIACARLRRDARTVTTGIWSAPTRHLGSHAWRRLPV